MLNVMLYKNDQTLGFARRLKEVFQGGINVVDKGSAIRIIVVDKTILSSVSHGLELKVWERARRDNDRMTVGLVLTPINTIYIHNL